MSICYFFLCYCVTLLACGLAQTEFTALNEKGSLTKLPRKSNF